MLNKLLKGYKSSNKTHSKTEKERTRENTNENTHWLKELINLKSSACVVQQIRLYRSEKTSSIEEQLRLLILIKFIYKKVRIECTLSLVERACSTSDSTKHRTELKLSHAICQFVLCQTILRTSFNHVSFFLPTLLECFSYFLCALQQNRAQSRLLYLLIQTMPDMAWKYRYVSGALPLKNNSLGGDR